LGGRFRTAGENDAFGRKRGDFSGVVIPGPDLAINADFAHPAGDQLRVLGAKVEDQNPVSVEV